jgi:SAM-dependent methyltransferase
VLATGESAAYRLRLLHRLYEEGTRHVLLEAGLRPGMCVADVGCGVGMVTALLAELVGPKGQVVGIDASGAQLAVANERLPPAVRSASSRPALSTPGCPASRSTSYIAVSF